MTSLPEQIEELKDINASLWCSFFSKVYENDTRVIKLNKQLKEVQSQFERFKKKKFASAEMMKTNEDMKTRIANMNIEIQLLRGSIVEFQIERAKMYEWIKRRGEEDAREKQELAYEVSYFKNN